MSRKEIRKPRKPLVHVMNKVIPSDSNITVDIMLIGSRTCIGYVHALYQMWVLHKSVRNVFGFTEDTNFDPNCDKMSLTEMQKYISKCKAII